MIPPLAHPLYPPHYAALTSLLALQAEGTPLDPARNARYRNRLLTLLQRYVKDSYQLLNLPD